MQSGIYNTKNFGGGDWQRDEITDGNRDFYLYHLWL